MKIADKTQFLLSAKDREGSQPLFIDFVFNECIQLYPVFFFERMQTLEA